jgi:hypothetical protein
MAFVVSRAVHPFGSFLITRIRPMTVPFVLVTGETLDSEGVFKRMKPPLCAHACERWQRRAPWA